MIAKEDSEPASAGTGEKAERIRLRADLVGRLRDRCEQRQILVETNRSRVLLSGERRRVLQTDSEERREEEEEEAWLRAEMEAMRAAGWSEEELREIGFRPSPSPSE